MDKLRIPEREADLGRHLARHPSDQQIVDEARSHAKGRRVGVALLDQVQVPDATSTTYRFVVAEEGSDRAALIHATLSDASEDIIRSRLARMPDGQDGQTPTDWVIEEVERKTLNGDYDAVVAKLDPIRVPTPSD